MAQKVELLAPAGTYETLEAVVRAGADAVYFGGQSFGARAYAGNFSAEEVLRAIDFGHMHGRKMFLAVNTLLKEREMEEQLYDYLLPFYEQGLDGVIVQDFGVMRFLCRNFCGLPVHASTQMTVTGVQGARFLEQAGAKRIVLSRELSLAEIQKIHGAVCAELETFVHGALCYSYSGQCLFSSMLGGRSGNRGRCAQPCRLGYDVYREGKKITKQSPCYPLSPKDLCTVDLIPQLAKRGVYSLKIEGRMKQTEYAAGVVSIYRKYIDRYLSCGEEGYRVEEEDKKKLLDLGNRCGFTQGYLRQKNGSDMITFQKPGHEKKEVALSLEACKEKVDGRIVVKKEMPMELLVSFRGLRLTVTGDVPKAAKTRPVTEETLREKLNKTGGTPFVFGNLVVDLEEGLYVSAASLNEMRRKAMEQLEEQWTARFRRIAKARAQDKVYQGRREEANTRAQFSASAETREQLMLLLAHPLISDVCLDAGAFARGELEGVFWECSRRAKALDKQMHLILPAVFRQHTADFYASVLPQLQADGFLVKSYDALGFLLEHGVNPERIRLDHNMYTWSGESRRAFLESGVWSDTVPLELNRSEIMRRANSGSEMVIYGHLPLMTSAQCVKKNLSGCDKAGGVCFLKDRYRISFPVKNYCAECYNVIYNSRPLCLFSALGELMAYGIGRFRLAFTVETPEQTREALSALESTASLDVMRQNQSNTLRVSLDAMRQNQSNTLRVSLDAVRQDQSNHFTYGHYRRGVE